MATKEADVKAAAFHGVLPTVAGCYSDRERHQVKLENMPLYCHLGYNRPMIRDNGSIERSA